MQQVFPVRFQSVKPGVTPVVQPKTEPVPVLKPLPSDSVKFGACVNAALGREQFQSLLLQRSWAERLHAVASAGQLGKEDLTDVLSSYLLKKNAFSKAPLRDDVTDFMVLALTESALKNRALKEKVLGSLREARGAKHLRGKEDFIDEAISKIEHDGKKPPSEAWKQREAQYHRNRNHGSQTA